ncbi:amidase [Novosphingobium mangrovi (ex Huang et al. 2023)]|uniref:Amidase n=1 Tax=Novosphingobium mangrovi (ex Huang et al. 2023) TaxID=2976432 RepID=A0ABT2I4J5_9SPHN|nr:amidase [Novosphingobium mangrovi (ex Huang et al. 2023)]MCT2399731.1 amidase [Novosphingobium mangrovi (ex Huang et al. 2023)]
MNRSQGKWLAVGAAIAIALPGAAAAQESPQTYLERIEAIDDAGPRLDAVIAIAPEIASEAPASAPLAGRAVLVKDNIETRDMATTAGSLALKDNMTGRDAPLVARLRKAGAVILGKTNLSEWANFRGDRSSSGWSGVGGQTRNPHAIDRSPCGSSAGSGAAVAAGLAWAAVGTETNGSITCPASVNGVVGFKPTVGLVSRTYVVPISATQDTAGPMTANVHDAALLLTAMAGSDPADAATAEADRHAVDFTKGLAEATLKGVRIGVLRKQAGKLPGVLALFDRAVADMKRAGAEIVEIDYEPDETMWRDENTLLLYEFREGIDAYLADLPGVPPARDLAGLIAFDNAHADEELRWYGQETFEEAFAATDTEAYRKALENAQRLAGPEGIDRLMTANRVDVLVAPTTGPAWPIDLVNGDHFMRVGAGSLAAISGYPHLSVPMGQVERLPVGLSFMAGKWQDAKVLRIGAAYERARTAPLSPPSFQDWHQ